MRAHFKFVFVEQWAMRGGWQWDHKEMPVVVVVVVVAELAKGEWN